ncbi:uncharacterized protein LOC105736854 [Apis florea]|uniref:uncharacterized protein LOC105736854 n=1 Tax=Apis florea TaxID=7463 RepID=UPI0006298BA2|nr:uncharacterized protein LOC105736854 [Apis florea]XP_012348844.1 uncharacterized protein LOC105736854 [Apis florea]
MRISVPSLVVSCRLRLMQGRQRLFQAKGNHERNKSARRDACVTTSDVHPWPRSSPVTGNPLYVAGSQHLLEVVHDYLIRLKISGYFLPFLERITGIHPFLTMEKGFGS